MTPKFIVRATFLALGCSIASPSPAIAQDEGRGGLSSSLVISERLVAGRNQALVPGGTDLSAQSVTTLGYSFLSETRTQSLSFDAGLGLLGSITAGGDPTFGLGERNLSFGYAIEGVRSSLDLSADATQSDVSYVRPLEDFIEDGAFVLPEDFDDLSGAGTLTELSFGARLTMRDDAPFGITLSADVNDITYRNVTDPELVDSTRLGFGLTGRLDISSTIQASAGLRYSTFEDGAGGSGDSITYSADVTFTEPRGTLGFGLSATPTDAGTQLGFDVSRSFDLPGGSLDGRVGVTLTAADETVLTGGLDYRLDRPNGSLSASLDHSVASDAGQTGDVATSLSVVADTALSPDITASLRAGYARNREAGSDVITSLADLGGSVSYALSPDWSMSAGATYVLRDPSNAEAAAAQSLSLTLTRTFDMRR